MIDALQRPVRREKGLKDLFRFWRYYNCPSILLILLCCLTWFPPNYLIYSGGRGLDEKGMTSMGVEKEGIQKLSAELARIPPPTNPHLKKEYDNFCYMVRLASEDPNLTIVFTTG